MNGSARLENNGARRTVCTGPVKGAKAPLKIAVGAVDPGKPTNVKHTQILVSDFAFVIVISS